MTGTGQNTFVPKLDLSPDQVREARRLLGWKQATLAEEAGISVGSVSKVESGIAVRDVTKAAIMTALSDAGAIVDEGGHVRRRPQR